MSTVALVPPLQTVVPDASAVVPLVIVVLTGGVVGMSIRNMFESIMSEDDENDPGADAGDEDIGGGGLMAEDDGGDDGGDDDLGGLGGLDDGDDLGGFGDDEFGDMDDEGGGNTGELEHRLDELENEVGSLSSTVNTVRNENEQISESVADVEENVRKLLDIYEMVTRGVNPFADDIDAGMAGGMDDGGSFGLFDDGDEEPEEADVDEDLAAADAEGFFDEDLVEDDEELAAEEDVGVFEDGDDEVDVQESFDEEFEEFEDDGLDDEGDDAGGTSFADLKEEYESGDADWVDGEGEEEVASDDDGDDAAEEDDGFADDDLFDEVVEEEPANADPDGTADAAGVVETAKDEAEAADSQTAADDADEATVETGGDPETESATEPTTREASSTAGDEGKPYLASVPEGFAADLIVVEWLEFLVEEVGVRETARALDYYESIDWIDPAVAEDLEAYLAGFDGGGSGTLTIDHHTQSLSYIGQLDGGSAAARGLLGGGGSDGIQR